MMRLLKERDRSKILAYFNQESNYNIFAIGDIEHFGFNQDFQQIYATFDPNETITAGFLRYRENGGFYTCGEQSFEPFAHLIDNHQLNYFNVKSSLADRVSPYLEGWVRKDMYFCTYSHLDPVPSLDHACDIKLCQSESDFEALYDLLQTIDEFGINHQSKQAFVDSKMKALQMGKVLAIWDNNQIVSTAATTAETTKNAMVVGVATKPEYRNKGYASMLMIALQRYYKSMDKDLCLFFDNPNAGSIYHRIGFRDTGMWTMFQKRVQS